MADSESGFAEPADEPQTRLCLDCATIREEEAAVDDLASALRAANSLSATEARRTALRIREILANYAADNVGSVTDGLDAMTDSLKAHTIAPEASSAYLPGDDLYVEVLRVNTEIGRATIVHPMRGTVDIHLSDLRPPSWS